MQVCGDDNNYCQYYKQELKYVCLNCWREFSVAWSKVSHEPDVNQKNNIFHGITSATLVSQKIALVQLCDSHYIHILNKSKNV